MGRSDSQKPKKQVEVIKCPSAFPVSSKASSSKKRQRDFRDGSNNNNNRKEISRKTEKGLLDWHETAKEIRNYGAQAFSGKQKRDFQDEQYFQLTGRHKKKPSCPLPILRGIKKAAVKREARQRQEAKEAGVVIPKAKKEDKKYDSTYRSFGPAPSIGFVKKGVYKMKNHPGKKKR
jgi:hypothetical protein